MSQVTVTAAALYWQQLHERTPELPQCLAAAMPDPNCRSEHFRWSAACYQWWTGQGVTAADAGVLWGSLIADRLAATDPHWREHGVTAGVWRWQAAMRQRPSRRRCGNGPAGSGASTRS